MTERPVTLPLAIRPEPFKDDLSPPTLGPFLDRLLLRSDFSCDERDALLALPFVIARIDSHRDFVRLGERVDHACLVVSGMIGRFDQTAQGLRQITAFHIPGDMPDLHSVVRPVVTSALQALCATTILRVPHAALRALAARFPAIAEALWRDCMVDTATLNQWIVNIGRRPAQARLAYLLCEMAVRVRGVTGDGAFAFPVTQAQLGDASGLTAVHVNRSLKALRDAGLVEIRSRTATIRDWSRLARLADFDPAYLLSDVRSAATASTLVSA